MPRPPTQETRPPPTAMPTADAALPPSKSQRKVCRESGVIGMSEWVVIPGNFRRFTRNLLHLWG
jgi:hypothetical protein